MTWEEKLDALSELADVALKMRKPGDWYVSMRGVSIADGHLLTCAVGNGSVPELAVCDLWRQLTELPNEKCIEVSGPDGVKRYRWSRFMWREVKPEAKTI